MTARSDTAREGDAPIVVGVDGSQAAAAAAHWAAALAGKFDAPLELVTGLSTRGTALADAAAALLSPVSERQRHWATSVLQRHEKDLRTRFPGLDLISLRCDVPAGEALATRSNTARMVVLGTDQVSPAAAILVGSTTLTVAARSACPVVAWRGKLDTPTAAPIVVGVDDPAVGMAAFDAAFEVAARLGVELRAVHAWPKFRLPGLVNPYLTDADAFETLQWQGLLTALDPWTARYPGVKVRYYLEPESANTCLLRHAEDAQLVVVGGRRRGVLASALLGSTSLSLLHHCPVPVMVCHRQPSTG
ncbi:universal stress protein [Mycolicibacterium flavescens]|uniref:Universal stress protein UspA n=1 Tax=Mycolicibacterium flavescens TaxID=1776 RepID=A0A1E3R8E2_MYCFV|nr:universal stress protein [Mycolicibacterium flavescens]MCV7282618.1 universal stress protein [Mycolicibacterium flavescens]ODQ86094.1 universal stress protein UspA [Mycolicibacterium flavescens]